ncbi:MAG: hypothetical protein CVV64_17710 [Candidatus Wallbacteria bacterium HGW-Wallbacteria-1]|jgi:radical SAM protein with 4Fe4S-binding SPASM domain|uniref:Radical SAM core domain-containing protein n=1 Tax=Candidatus Wallbacteria bacterium HGW-Wallbacteria-1 TaxID=2013854 RepID=A0A2N1PK38_9BACT|nr:MAG: hypothetical protein CVV64_17710 [Candidatus Wallbacteria bacterium HGW-Wallbacteria-1]
MDSHLLFSGWGAFNSGLIKQNKYSLPFRKFVNDSMGARYRCWNSARILEVELTTRCGNNCPYCGNSSGDANGTGEGNINGTDLPFEELKRIIQGSIDAGSPPDQISLAGGDPFLHPHFREIVSYIGERKIPLQIKANTSTFTESMGIHLRESGCRVVKFTLFGGAGHHDGNRGSDTFDSLLEKSRLAVEQGFMVIWNLTIGAGMLDDALETLPMALQYGVSGVTLARLAPIGRNIGMDRIHGKDENSGVITPAEYRDFLLKLLKFQMDVLPSGFQIFFKEKLWLPLLVEEGLIDLPTLRSSVKCSGSDSAGDAVSSSICDSVGESVCESVGEKAEGYSSQPCFGCEAYGVSLALTPEGDILPCGLMRTVNMGNIRDFDQFPWSISRDYLDFKGPKSCSGCEFLALCRGCRGAAMGTSLDQHAPDPQCWVAQR